MGCLLTHQLMPFESQNELWSILSSFVVGQGMAGIKMIAEGESHLLPVPKTRGYTLPMVKCSMMLTQPLSKALLSSRVDLLEARAAQSWITEKLKSSMSVETCLIFTGNSTVPPRHFSPLSGSSQARNNRPSPFLPRGCRLNEDSLFVTDNDTLGQRDLPVDHHQR